MRDWKMHDWMMPHQFAVLEFTGLEIAVPKSQDWNLRELESIEHQIHY